MHQKVYRLPSSRPVVWRTPDELQVGIDWPHTTVKAIPSGATALVHALSEGISEGGVSILQRQLQLRPDEVTGLLEQLEVALEPDPPAVSRSISIVGTSGAVPVMAGVIEAMGVEVSRVGDIHDLAQPGSFGVVLVADYVAHPDWISVLGSSDIAHTPVIFSDLSIRVGPAIRPGITPCLCCIESARRLDHPHWLAIDSQLWGTASPLATPESGATAAVLTALCHGLLGALPEELGGGPGVALDYRPGVAELQRRVVDFDPQCTCRGMTPD